MRENGGNEGRRSSSATWRASASGPQLLPREQVKPGRKQGKFFRIWHNKRCDLKSPDTALQGKQVIWGVCTPQHLAGTPQLGQRPPYRPGRPRRRPAGSGEARRLIIPHRLEFSQIKWKFTLYKQRKRYLLRVSLQIKPLL